MALIKFIIQIPPKLVKSVFYENSLLTNRRKSCILLPNNSIMKRDDREKVLFPRLREPPDAGRRRGGTGCHWPLSGSAETAFPFRRRRDSSPLPKEAGFVRRAGLMPEAGSFSANESGTAEAELSSLRRETRAFFVAWTTKDLRAAGGTAGSLYFNKEREHEWE